MAVEKRKYERVAPQENAFAALGRQYAKVGRIKDISLGGVAFEYFSAADKDRDSSRIDIFLVGDLSHLYNIPCEVVYDFPNPSIKNVSIKLSPTKRCGVRFETLTEEDMVRLKLFLKSHT